ncbi:hypothetical protein [Brachyspira sp. SAP_772]|uniref:hypothetical protein n=1 Tax=Brachyspira sp. SAP_772 TaxID=2608385 RepID=UPI0012F4FF81|nr:hypothetical protein [Brachyspira sp. SAP_772]
MKIKIIKIVLFISIFIFIFIKINKTLILKSTYGINQFNIFYKQEKRSVDVLFFGSSRVFFGINPGILYKDYGISSYNLATSLTPFWQIYFSVKESLKTQTPKLIVIEAYTTVFVREYTTKSSILNFISGLKISELKLNAIKVSVPKKEIDKYFNFMYQYHDRYSILKKNDFINDNSLQYFKGFSYLYNTEKNVKYSTNLVRENLKLYSKTEEYYRKTIELVKKYDIPILIILSPYINIPLTYNHKKIFNSAENIANEYDIPFIDFNLYYDEYKLNFYEDFNDWTHLNYKGSTKFTRYLGKYLKENYDLADRRGDPKYYSWEINAEYQDKEIYNFELKQYTNLNKYIEKVKNADDYVIGITMLGNYQSNDIIVQNIISNFNINDIYLQNSSYVIDNNKLIYSSSSSNQYLFYDEIGNYTDLVVDSGRKLSINRTNYIKTTNGINMVIYDKFTEEIVDNIYLEYKDNSIDTTIKR